MDDFNRLYTEAVEFLDSKQAYFLTHVLNMGSPCLSGEVDTAAVGLQDGKLVFWVNPDFASLLDGPGLAFVLSHETLHAKLKHPQMSQDFDSKELFNKAADAVINDYLVNILDIDLAVVDGMEFVTGLNSVGVDCEWFSVREVYEMLICQGSSATEATCSGGNVVVDASDLDESDGGFAYLPDDFDISDFLDGSDENIWPDSLPSVEVEGFGCSVAPGVSPVKEVALDKNLTLNWVELLREVIPDFGMSGSGKSRASVSYHARPRKLSGFYAKGVDVALPVSRPNPKGRLKDRQLPRVVLALDTSGSISANTVRRFLSLARSVPDAKAEVFTCTFTTSYMPLDVKNPKYVSGGTNFSAVEDFIRLEVLPKSGNAYPDMVIVVTDGQSAFYGSSPTAGHLPSWKWLIDSKQNVSYFKRMGVFNYSRDGLEVEDKNVSVLDTYVK